MCWLGPWKKQWGIPNGCRARPILFQTATLQKSTAAYPVIGQKKLSGAASRMMVHWASAISRNIRESHPCETNRCDHFFECISFCIFKSSWGEILDSPKFLLVPWVMGCKQLPLPGASMKCLKLCLRCRWHLLSMGPDGCRGMQLQSWRMNIWDIGSSTTVAGIGILTFCPTLHVFWFPFPFMDVKLWG